MVKFAFRLTLWICAWLATPWAWAAGESAEVTPSVAPIEGADPTREISAFFPEASATLDVVYENGELSVQATEVPLRAILERIGQSTGLTISTQHLSRRPIHLRIERLPLTEALDRMLGEFCGYSLMLNEVPFDGAGGTGQLILLGCAEADQRTATRGSQPVQATAPLSPAEGASQRPPGPLSQSIDVNGPAGQIPLQQALQHKDDDVRAKALDSLSDRHETLSEEEIASTLAPILLDPDPKLRKDALRILSELHHDAAALALAGALDDEDPKLRGEVVKALAENRSPAALVGLQRALEDPSEEVYEMAKRALEDASY